MLLLSIGNENHCGVYERQDKLKVDVYLLNNIVVLPKKE
jgi:hypothetical protein